MSSHVQAQGGLLTGTFWFVTKVIFWSILGFIVAQIITVLLLVIFSQQQAFAFIDSLILIQLNALNSVMSHFGVLASPIGGAVTAVQHAGVWVLKTTHSIKTINIGVKNPLVDGFAKTALPMGQAFITASVATMQLTALRLLNLLVMIPMFFWVGLLGLTDGLVQRDLRTFSGGRESALSYHRARSMILPSVLIGIFLYLILPLNIAPDLMLLPFVVAFGFSISIAARAFKKYV